MIKTSKKDLFFPQVILILFLLSWHGNSQQQMGIRIIEGYNDYYPLKHYYSTYERIQISDLENVQDGKLYNFCYLSPAQIQHIQQIDQKQVFNRDQDHQNKVQYNLQQILRMQKIITSIYSKSMGVIFVLLPTKVKTYRIEDNKTLIQLPNNLLLAEKTISGQFIQTQKQIILLTDKKLLTIQSTSKQTNQFKITQKISLPSPTQSNLLYNLVQQIGQKLFISTGNTILVYNKTSLLKLSEISLQGFDLQSDNFLYFNQEYKILLIADQQTGIWIATNYEFKTDLKASRKTLFHLPGTKKCKQINAHQKNYLFLQCSNKILYFHTKQLLKCRKSPNKDCYDHIKLQQYKNGNKIQDVFFQNHQIYVFNNKKLQILSMITKQQPDNQTNIVSLNRAQTYSFNQQIHMLLTTKRNDQFILLTKNQVILTKTIQRKNQIFCRTVDQNTRMPLSHNAGIYNGTISFYGICCMNRTRQIKSPVNGTNLCKTQIPLRIEIVSHLQRYRIGWIILIAMVCVFVVVNVIYFLYNRRVIKSQYKLFEDQKQVGQKVIQQSMQTQGNQ